MRDTSLDPLLSLNLYYHPNQLSCLANKEIQTNGQVIYYYLYLFARAAVRDCGPQLTSLNIGDKDDMVTTEPEVLAPRHTKLMVMEIPVELPSEMSHCIGKNNI